VLLKDGRDFAHLTRRDEDTPYIFQSGTRHPGKYTLETTRAGGGPLAAIANLRLFGRHGLQALLGHIVAMAEELRDQLDGHASTTVMNGDNFGPVTLFRVYPDGVDTFAMPAQERENPAMRDTLLRHNAYNRRIFELIQADALQGRGVVISLTDCYRLTDYGEPINALKSYILSPFSDDEHVSAVLESLWKARHEAAAEFAS
jgi:glutamate/tyrosine decarboxylase-like PLP-dependent enzyme